jgi:hypothetical protein
VRGLAKALDRICYRAMDEDETNEIEPTALHRSMAIAFQLLVGVLILVVLAISLHALAMANDYASRRLPKFGSRLAAAERAAAVEPWNPSIKVRLTTLQAQLLVQQNQIDEAYELLQPLSHSAGRDSDFDATYKQVQRMRALEK